MKFIQVGIGDNLNVKYAFFNTKNLESICGFIYESIGSFKVGFAIAERQNKEVIINTKEKEISYKYDDIGYFRAGVAIKPFRRK